MKALVLEKNKVIVYKEVDLITPKDSPDKLLVKIVSAGICGSDIQRGFFNGAYHYPLIMGHEFAGVIEKTVSTSRFKPGNKVVIYPLLPCKTCPACQTGDYAQCVDYNYFGSRCDGGFSEYLYVPEQNLFPVPDHVDIMHAAMVEPAAVALHGVLKLNIKPGDTAAVYGAGPVGNMTAQWLRIKGCPRVIVIDIDPRKLAIAQDMGFITINPQENNPVETVYSLTDHHGANCVVEACGLPITFLQAIKSTGCFGRVVFMGNIHGEFKINEKDFSDILRKELKIYGTWNSKVVPRGNDDWSAVLKYMDRGLNVAPLISHTPLLEEGAQVFNRIIEGKEFFNKVIFKTKRQ